MALLTARSDFEAQRMWMRLAHSLVYRFTRKSMVYLYERLPGIR